MGNRILLVLVLLAVAVGVFLWMGAPPPPAPPAAPPAAPKPTVNRPAEAQAPAPAVEAPVATPAPVKAPVPVNALVVKGRVVDDRRFPIAGARVTLHRSGDSVLSAVAGADGRFRLEGIPRPATNLIMAGILARAPDGRIAVGQAFLASRSPAEIDAGTMVVGAAVPLAVRAMDGGAPVAGARIHVGWGYSWPLEATAGADGVARFDALPRQTVNILAMAGNPARAGRSAAALLGNPPQPVDVLLAPTRTIEVAVVEKGTEKPIAGATFKVRLQQRSPGMVMSIEPGPLPPVAPTDAEGRTRIEGTCAADYLSLDEVAAPGFFPSGFRQGTTVKPGDVQVRIELVGGRSLRFPVVAGEAPVPPDGAAIVLSPMPGSGGPAPTGGARMEGAELVVECATAGFYMADATAPDGSRARLWADDKGTPPKEVSFRPGRTVSITAKRADGTPAAGSAFALRNQGNNPLAEPKSAGDDGRVVFAGLYGEMAEIYLLDDPSQPWGGRTVGSVNLARGDGTLEIVLPAKRSFVARITVDGTPRLAPQMFLNGVARFDEDPEKGEIRFEMPLDPATKSVTLYLNALPYLPAKATVEPLPETGPIPLEFALLSGGVLLVEVKAPKDTSYRLNLQRWDAEKSAWMAANIPGGMMGPALAPGPDGIARAEPLVEGRYRAVEAMTGVASEDAEVRAGGEPARLSIDLARQGYAKGKVSIPEGAKMADVRILVTGPGMDARPTVGSFDNMATRCQPDGQFMVRIPGDRAVTLVPWHPTLVPAPEGGTAELTEAREGISLRLVAGARAVLRLDPAPTIAPFGDVKPRVCLFTGDPAGEPVSEHPMVQEGEGFAFGGFKPGTWTLWIDPTNGRAPTVVRGAVLAESGTDLGTIAFAEGSRVRVKILVKEGSAAPRIGVFANREEAPKYWRAMNSNGEETAVLGGLGPGRFRITVSGIMGTPGKSGINEVHELDGTNDLELTLDLR